MVFVKEKTTSSILAWKGMANVLYHALTPLPFPGCLAKLSRSIPTLRMDCGSYLYIPWSASTSKDWSSSGLPLVLARPGSPVFQGFFCLVKLHLSMTPHVYSLFQNYVWHVRGGRHNEHRRNIHHHWRCGIWFSAEALQMKYLELAKYSINININGRPATLMFDPFVNSMEQGRSKGRAWLRIASASFTNEVVDCGRHK